MSGGTTFHFVTDGIHAAMERAVRLRRDVRLGGGVATIRQYLRAGLIDEMHLAMPAVLLASGECLLEGIDLPKLGYQCSTHVYMPNMTHFVITKRGKLVLIQEYGSATPVGLDDFSRYSQCIVAVALAMARTLAM
jgi:dihydrofolate reductase